MTTAIASIAAVVLGGIGAFFTWKSSGVCQRRSALSDIKKEKESIDMKKAEIREAVYSNDDDKLNQIVSKLIAPCCCALVVLSSIGCASQKPAVQYIPTDRRIETVTNSIGIVCKAVPNAVMAEMLEKLQELDDLKTEMKVDKRVSK